MPWEPTQVAWHYDASPVRLEVRHPAATGSCKPGESGDLLMWRDGAGCATRRTPARGRRVRLADSLAEAQWSGRHVHSQRHRH
ncbi:Uncharacterised protein [Chlamydia trachomatis]|nr:Uncharacterised protein [Chlamydia trachomatis]